MMDRLIKLHLNLKLRHKRTFKGLIYSKLGKSNLQEEYTKK